MIQLQYFELVGLISRWRIPVRKQVLAEGRGDDRTGVTRHHLVHQPPHHHQRK